MARLIKRAQPRDTGKPATGVPLPIPAPSRGMNTLDNYLALPPDQARHLENWLPTTGRCTVRPGYSASATINGAAGAGSLLEYRGEAGTTLLVADDMGEILNGSVDPATELASGYSTAPWSYDNLGGYLIAVNGADTPWRYNGSTIAATGITGVTLTTLRTVKKVRTRLWFTANASAKVWYLGPSFIAGALTEFDLGQIAGGGKCMGVFPWKDYTVFVMSTGEVLIYAGDPATDFSKYGSYKAPPLVAYDAAVEIGGDLVLMTVAGPITLELIAAGLAFDVDSLQGWGKISPSWTADCTTYGANTGWNAAYHNGMAYFNVPTSATEAKQYVNNLNVPGGAWTVYTGFNAGQFAQTAEGLFFSDKANGRVCKHAGALDDGESVIAIARQGFTYPTQGRTNLQYTLARINYATNGIAHATTHVDVDFQNIEFSSAEVPLSLEGGSGPWDQPFDYPWGTDPTTQLRWQKVKGHGKAVAPAVKVRSDASVFDWFSTEVISAPAGMI
jgi:hypothetical protein